MILLVVLVMLMCYLIHHLFAAGSGSARAPKAGRDDRRGATANPLSTQGGQSAVSVEADRWTALDDFQLRRLLEQASP